MIKSGREFHRELVEGGVKEERLAQVQETGLRRLEEITVPVDWMYVL